MVPVVVILTARSGSPPGLWIKVVKALVVEAKAMARTKDVENAEKINLGIAMRFLRTTKVQNQNQ